MKKYLIKSMFKQVIFTILFLTAFYFTWWFLKMCFCLIYVKLAVRKNKLHLVNFCLVKVEKKDESLKMKIKNKIILAVSGFFRYQLILVGKIPSHFIRMFLYRYIFGMKIAKNAVIYGGAEIRSPWNISIGKGTIIGDESKLDGRNGLEIGENVNLSTGVWIWTDEHDKDDPNFACNNKGGKVIIENRVWISARAIILPKVKIKEGAVVAALAVVTKDVESYNVVGGVPAKLIFNRNRDLHYNFNGDHLWFF